MYGRLHALVVAQNFHFDSLPGLMRPQRIGEIVEILNRGVSELDQDIARFQARFRSRRFRGDIGESHTTRGLCEVGSTAEVRPVAASGTSELARVRIVLLFL